MLSTLSSRLCVGLLSMLPLAALAQPLSVLTTRAVNVRAGPDPVFPLVAWLPQGEQVRVVGCLRGSKWCDVVSGRTRGWLHSNYLSGVQRDRTPEIGFSVADYWAAHYQRRPWYSSVANWVDWESPSFQPPPLPPGGLFRSR